jgi:tRNA G18 (ribose-2'-O)-methylase SpoU
MRKLKHEEIPRLSTEEVEQAPRHPVVVVVDNVRSIYNVGSIFRTSDAVHIRHLYLTGITGTPDHRGVHKTALGAQDTVPWSHHRDAEALVSHLRAESYTIAALEITDSPTLTDAIETEHFPLCLIVGNEIFGVSEALLALSDLALELPQYGSKQSLNVAVAYGIAVYDLVRNYRPMLREPS